MASHHVLTHHHINLSGMYTYPSIFVCSGWIFEVWSKVHRDSNVSIEGHSRVVTAPIDVLESYSTAFAISVIIVFNYTHCNAN